MNHSTTPMETKASTPISVNMPDMPMYLYSSGDSTIEIENVMPMVIPIIAIALVRCSSRVRSAVSAITAALIAPAP